MTGPGSKKLPDAGQHQRFQLFGGVLPPWLLLDQGGAQFLLAAQEVRHRPP
jgi:hypothetical protein